MRRAALLVLLLSALSGTSSAQEAASAPDKQPDKKGFLGVGLQAKALPGSEPAQSCPAVTTVVPGSAAEKAGIVVGDELRALDGESLVASPDQAVAGFIAKIKGRPAGTRVRLLIRRTQLSLRTTV